MALWNYKYNSLVKTMKYLNSTFTYENIFFMQHWIVKATTLESLRYTYFEIACQKY